MENPLGYHRLIGGSVERGETHRDAIEREVTEELGATITHLEFVAVVENILTSMANRATRPCSSTRDNSNPHRPTSMPPSESDGSTVPITWRPFDDTYEPLPLYPAQATGWIRRLVERR